MPTNAFFKLDKNRQQEIIEAARHEFINNRYEAASINQIIKEIDMSRGSFYLYFANKEDIYFYIFDQMRNNFEELFLDEYIKNKEDLKKTLLAIYKLLISNQRTHGIFKNVFLDFKPKQISKLQDCRLIKEISLKKYNIDEDQKDIAMHLILTILFQAVGMTLQNLDKKEQLDEFFISQINLILRKEESND